MVLYGVEIWYWDLKDWDKLLTIQRNPLIAIAKCFSTVSHAPLQVMSSCLPLDLRAQEVIEIDKEFNGTYTGGDTDLKCNFEQFSKILTDKVNRIPWKYHKEAGENSIFTDGSKIDGRVGCAFVHFENGIKRGSRTNGLSVNSSVFMTEMAAIKREVAYAIGKEIRRVNIVRETQSSLQLLYPSVQMRAHVLDIKEMIWVTAELLSLNG